MAVFDGDTDGYPAAEPGRFVRYRPRRNERMNRACSQRAFVALIVYVNQAAKTVNLTVFDHQGGTFARMGASFDQELREEGTWKWPDHAVKQKSEADHEELKKTFERHG